ncbi:MAG: endonuclease/exonuclease/phosphatase family protein [Candidatus Kariarchaeaceae archaeon]
MNKRFLIISVLILLFTSMTSSNMAHSSTPTNELTGAAIPMLNFSNPENESTVGDIVSLILEVTNGEEIEVFEIYIDGDLVSNNKTYQWNTVNETAGEHTILGRAKNLADQWGEVTYVLSVDSSYVSGVFNLLNYNILEAARKNDDWLEIVKQSNPEIIVLVETGDMGEPDQVRMNSVLNQLNALFPDEDPYVGYATETLTPTSFTDGEAVFSRFPIISVNQIDELYLDDGTVRDSAHDFVEVVVEIGEMQTYIIGAHLSCCDGGQANREKDMEGIINYMDELGEVPIIYTGDMNCFSPFDVGEIAPDPGNLGTEPIAKLLIPSDPHASKIHTFKDVYRELNPSYPGFTYIDPFYKSRIDYIFVNDYFYGSLVNSTVITPEINSYVTTASDHFPMEATFNMDHTTYDIQPPIPVEGVNATIYDDASINLNWHENPEKDLNNYIVYKDGVEIGQTTETTINDTILVSTTIYQFTVAATDLDGNIGLKSRELLINTSYGVLTKPSAPILTVEFVNGDAILNWTVGSDGGSPILKYRIFRSLVNGGQSVLYASTTEPYYVDDVTLEGRSYFYEIKADNRVGSSNKSNIQGGTVPEVTTTPDDSDESPLFGDNIVSFIGITSFIALLPILRRKIKR